MIFTLGAVGLWIFLILVCPLVDEANRLVYASWWEGISSVQLLSHVRPYDSMDWSIPGLPVHLQLSEPTENHVHWVGEAIQPSHPLASPSPPSFNLSQHQHLRQWVSSSHQVAKVLEFQLQHQPFKSMFPLGWTGWISLQSKGLSRVFSSTTVQKHQSFGSKLSL